MDKLTKVYFDHSHPAGYSGIQKLKKATGATNEEIDNFAASVSTYNKFKPVRKKFKRAALVQTGLNQNWSADTLNLSQLADHNNNIHHVLVVIDHLSRYLWTRGLSSLQASIVVEAFESILIKEKTAPALLMTDNGKEFKNSEFQELCSWYGIINYSSFIETKAFLAERVIKSVKSKLWRAMYKAKSWRYIDYLQKITDSYNSTVHSSTGFQPKNVGPRNEIYLKNKLNKAIKNPKNKPKFQKGDIVRISYSVNPFTKGFRQTFTNETFIVDKVIKRPPVYLYNLKDQSQQKIKGAFYSQQLVRALEHEAEI